MKRTGVVVDTYKAKKYREAFAERKWFFTEYGGENVIIFKLYIEDHEVQEVGAICTRLEMVFNAEKRKN